MNIKSFFALFHLWLMFVCGSVILKNSIVLMFNDNLILGCVLFIFSTLGLRHFFIKGTETSWEDF